MSRYSKPRRLSPATRRKIAEANRRRWKAKKAGENAKIGRQRHMSRNAAARLRYLKKTAALQRGSKRSAEEKDARNAGASILGEKELRRPTFIVITPAGRRIETLEPDLA